MKCSQCGKRDQFLESFKDGQDFCSAECYQEFVKNGSNRAFSKELLEMIQKFEKESEHDEF